MCRIPINIQGGGSTGEERKQGEKEVPAEVPLFLYTFWLFLFLSLFFFFLGGGTCAKIAHHIQKQKEEKQSIEGPAKVLLH